MNASNLSLLKEEVRKLREIKSLHSAETMLLLFLSALKTDETSHGGNNPDCSRAEVDATLLLADVLFDKSEFKRSHYFYKHSLQLMKFHSVSTQNKLMQQSSVSALPAVNVIETNEEANVRYSEVQCLIKLNEYPKALVEMEFVPSRLRDVKINLCLGKLYKSVNRRREAIKAYKEVVSVIPSCIEAIEALINLGMDTTELTGIIDDSSRYSKAENIFDDGLLHSLTLGLTHKKNCEYDKCESVFKKLSLSYPKNTFLLNQLGRCYADAEITDEAITVYNQIRRIDPNVTEGMDYFGIVLKNAELDGEISKLAHDVLAVSQHGPVGWLLVALYCESKGESEKALTFIEKAIQFDPKYSLAYRIKGSFLLSNGHPDLATIAYFQANSLDGDIQNSAGLIASHLALGKHRDALHSAKEVLLSMPRSSTAHLLMGDIYARAADGYPDAYSEYSKAIKINPNNKIAIYNLANILTTQEKYTEASQLLCSALNRVSCHRLRTIYAKVLIGLQRFAEAIEQLHLAISLSPDDSAEAAQELEALEQTISKSNINSSTIDLVEEDEIDVIEDEFYTHEDSTDDF